jgi:ubiquinone/menaquinone biosynthesis C-methylase UbiE
MLRYATGRACAEGIANLHLLHGNAMDLPIGSGVLDAAICCGALHLFPDIPRVLTEVQRTLKPGGRLVLAVFRHRGEGPLAAVRDRVRRALYGIASFTPDALRRQLDHAGFGDFRKHHGRGMWMIASAASS